MTYEKIKETGCLPIMGIVALTASLHKQIFSDFQCDLLLIALVSWKEVRGWISWKAKWEMFMSDTHLIKSDCRFGIK
jgi:hypothetical protein